MERNDLSCEPMDIDLSNQSVKDMDISYNDSINAEITFTRASLSNAGSLSTKQMHCANKSPGKQPIVKKYHINIQKPPRSYTSKLLKITTGVIIILISFVTYHLHYLKCCDQLNFDILNETLSNKIYGQSEAISQIIKMLELKTDSKILFLSGGTGVGKTYTSSLLLDTIGSCSNIYHYTMPTFKNTFSSDLMFGLTMCKMSLIIVDDLTINDMDVSVQIKHVIEKSVNLGKQITVFLIYSCSENNKEYDKICDETFRGKLFDNFAEIKAVKKFIHFEHLTEEHLEKCIEQELGDRKLNHRQLADVLKNFNVSLDGCKGVHSKMKYLLTA